MGLRYRLELVGILLTLSINVYSGDDGVTLVHAAPGRYAMAVIALCNYLFSQLCTISGKAAKDSQNAKDRGRPLRTEGADEPRRVQMPRAEPTTSDIRNKQLRSQL